MRGVWSGRIRNLKGLGLLALATLFAVSAAAEETAKIEQDALLQRIEKNDPSLIVLDVRSPEEFAAGHVPRAINIPYTHLPARIAELPAAAEKDIVVYCATGVRAKKAAKSFRENGYTRLLHLEGDMRLWEERQQPIEK